MNAVGEFDSRNGDGRIVKRLETGHRGTARFDCAMILLDHIVEVLGAPFLRSAILELPVEAFVGLDGSAHCRPVSPFAASDCDS